MYLIKLTMIGLSIFFSINTCDADNLGTKKNIESKYTDVLLKITLTYIQDCYTLKHKRGTQLAKCMADGFKQIPNTELFKVQIAGTTPGYLHLLMYNKAGYVRSCSLTLQKKMKVNECVKYHIQPLTKGQEISITPPIEITPPSF